MKDGDLVIDNLNAFNIVVSQLSSVDIKQITVESFAVRNLNNSIRSVV